MTLSTLLSSDVNIVLTTKTKYTEDRKNIPNNEALLNLCPAVKQVADVLGVDLKEAEYTFTVVRNKEGQMNAYAPSIGNRGGEVCLVWGKVIKPVSDLPMLIPSMDDQGKMVFTVDLDDETTYKFNVVFKKEYAKTNFNDFTKRLKNNKLAELLAEGFVPATKLNAIAPGEYKVTDVRENAFKGEVNFDIFLEDIGWVKSNAKIKRRLAAKDITISEYEPATLTIHGVTGQTNSGYDIVSVDFLSEREMKLPSFEF